MAAAHEQMNLLDIYNGNNCRFFNFTCSDSSYLEMDYMILYILGALVLAFTLCGNLFVIISICHFKQLHTPTNVLILSLALSDFLVGVFLMPSHLLMTEPCLLFKPVFCSLFNAVNFNLTFVSIYNISFIAVDRYLALSDPFLYSKVSVSKAVIVTTLLWILSLSYNWALLYFNGNFSFKCPSKCSPYLDEMWLTTDLVLIFILPCTTIIALYLRIFFIARKHIVAIRKTEGEMNRAVSVNNKDTTRSEIKAARSLGVLVLVFLMCLIPYYICSLSFDVTVQSYSLVVNITRSIFYLNSTINPVIYAFNYAWFQNSVKILFTLSICHADSSLMNVLSHVS